MCVFVCVYLELKDEETFNALKLLLESLFKCEILIIIKNEPQREKIEKKKVDEKS